MSASVPPQTEAMLDAAVRFQNFGDETHGVGELVAAAASPTFERTLGQHAVANLASAWPADRFALADAEGREVVIEHELLRVFVMQPIDFLLVLHGARGGNDERLRLAALEDGGAMRGGQGADLAPNRTDLIQRSAIDPGAGHRDFLEDALLQRRERRSKLSRRHVLARHPLPCRPYSSLIFALSSSTLA